MTYIWFSNIPFTRIYITLFSRIFWRKKSTLTMYFEYTLLVTKRYRCHRLKSFLFDLERERLLYELRSSREGGKDGWISVSLEQKKLDVDIPCLTLTLPWIRLRGIITALRQGCNKARFNLASPHETFKREKCSRSFISFQNIIKLLLHRRWDWRFSASNKKILSSTLFVFFLTVQAMIEQNYCKLPSPSFSILRVNDKIRLRLV